MGSNRMATDIKAPNGAAMTRLLEQYGCGPVRFSGADEALYERHLLFDAVVDPALVGPRERYEAIARSVRDVLSQRWLHIEQTYARQNPKRVYYLSMEFLIGRSLANNIMNLQLEPAAKRFVDDRGLDGLALLEQEPDAGLGNGGLGRLAACFLDSMATLQLPVMGYGLRYEYGIFKQTIRAVRRQPGSIPLSMASSTSSGVSSKSGAMRMRPFNLQGWRFVAEARGGASRSRKAITAMAVSRAGGRPSRTTSSSSRAQASGSSAMIKESEVGIGNSRAG
jgi:hypothetical protein